MPKIMLSPNDPSFFEPVLSPNAPACWRAGLTPVSTSYLTAPPREKNTYASKPFNLLEIVIRMLR